MVRESALDKAKEIVWGDREKTYGDPGINLERIALGWSVIFGVEVTAEQVAWAMVWLKTAREVNAVSEDNLVDAVGYLALIDRIRAEKVKETPKVDEEPKVETGVSDHDEKPYRPIFWTDLFFDLGVNDTKLNWGMN